MMSLRQKMNINSTYGKYGSIANGRTINQLVSEPTKYTVELQQDMPHNSHYTLDHIKDVMCSKLARELINSDKVFIKQDNTQFTKRYIAQVRLMPTHATKFIEETNVFRIGKEEFTEKEIEEALKSYYVDRFI